MFKVEKNDKAFKELQKYAESLNQPFKDVLLSDNHLDKVSDIFYSHMPKLVRMAMKKDKFKEFYKNNREDFVNKIAV